MELERRLKKSQIEPVYVLAGDEAFFRFQALGYIREALAGPGEEKAEVIYFEGPEARCEEVLSLLRTPSMFWARHLVVVEKAREFIAEHKEAIEGYIRSPGAGVWVLISDTIGKGAPGLVIECKALYENQIPGWIRKRARDYGKEISTEAAALLTEIMGTALWEIDQKLQAISIYLGEKKRVELEDVEALLPQAGKHRFWDLTDAIGQKKAERALRILQEQLLAAKSSQEIAGILAGLAWHLRRLLLVKRALVSGATPREIGDKVGEKRSFLLRRLLSQARLFSLEALEEKLGHLLEADLDMKTGLYDNRLAFDLSILKLCQ
ncbi:MAG: hypothetical protein AMS15_09035 [Planctomycetes bacterium DG_23]|nr:MAG: hypothetical protein AMS15_09035 [Planctomycetes bacterium DG_23]